MKRILIIFENGRSFPATLLEDKAPKTCEKVWESLPFSSIVRHSRWSGRELNFPFTSNGYPKRENQTISTSIGEIVYWRDWLMDEEPDVSEIIAIYYGAERTRSHRGDEPVHVFAKIDYTHFCKFANYLFCTLANYFGLEYTYKIRSTGFTWSGGHVRLVA